MINAERALVQKILRYPLGFQWSLQGFGMLRLHLEDGWRLHVWDDRYAVPNVSLIHDHPWNFTSHVVAGTIRNALYIRVSSPAGGKLYSRLKIKCGTSGCILSAPEGIYLDEMPEVPYEAGDRYSEKHSEIHRTSYRRGTVTLVKREVPAGGNPDHANVFYLPTEKWISAEPRPAEDREILDICHNSLKTWFGEKA